MTTSLRPVSIADLRHRYLNPNFTAILPGKCQARCPFCVEPEGPSPRSLTDWVASFDALVASELPPTFQIVSLSGGEPSLSPVFEDVLQLLGRHRRSGRLRRVVLTTNGAPKNIGRHVDLIGDSVTNVNISRHAADDRVNAGVFRTSKVPTHSELAEIISRLNRRGVPVNLNCVYSMRHAFGHDISRWSRELIRAAAKHYVDFAKTVGASSVVFRFDHRAGPTASTALEEAFSDYATLHVAQCESCRVVGKLVRGLPVNFKQSAFEPTALHLSTELYELVFHSDGGLYRDWSRNQPVQRPLPRMAFMDAVRTEQQALKMSVLASPVLECEERSDPCGLLTHVPDASSPFVVGA